MPPLEDALPRSTWIVLALSVSLVCLVFAIVTCKCMGCVCRKCCRRRKSRYRQIVPSTFEKRLEQLESHIGIVVKRD